MFTAFFAELWHSLGRGSKNRLWKGCIQLYKQSPAQAVQVMRLQNGKKKHVELKTGEKQAQKKKGTGGSKRWGFVSPTNCSRFLLDFRASGHSVPQQLQKLTHL